MLERWGWKWHKQQLSSIPLCCLGLDHYSWGHSSSISGLQDLDFPQPWILAPLQEVRSGKGLVWRMFLFHCFDRGEKEPLVLAVDPVFRRPLFQRQVRRRVSSFLFSLLSPEIGPQTNPVQGLGERQKRLEKVMSPLEERNMLAHKALQGPNSASCNSPIGTSRKHAASTEKLMPQMKSVEKRAERKNNYKWIAIV